MGIIALPAMLKRGYDHKIALGSIMAGGTLGILIPPSILAILYAVVAQQSVGELYLGAIVPGLMLSAMYVIYVLIRTKLNPEMGPPVPQEERISFKEKLLLLKDLIAPLILVMLVLGLLFGGVATPVEAAGIGSFGAILVALEARCVFGGGAERCLGNHGARIGHGVVDYVRCFGVRRILHSSGRSGVYHLLHSGYRTVRLRHPVPADVPAGHFWACFLDWVGILLLAVPIFIPIVKALTFDGLFGLPPVSGEDVVLWFGVFVPGKICRCPFLSPALWLRAVLHQGCVSSGNYHGHHLPILLGVPGASECWADALHPVPGVGYLVTQCGVRIEPKRSAQGGATTANQAVDGINFYLI